MISYKYNSKAKYAAGGVYHPYIPGGTIVQHGFQPHHRRHRPLKRTQSIKEINLISQAIWEDSQGSHFTAQFQNLFENYEVTIHDEKEMEHWNKNPMQFWQNQLHFAVWCSTSGCGISYKDHLSSKRGLAKSIFTFHVYYQVRRILTLMQVPLPQEKTWNANDNPYNVREYEKLCDEFGVSPHQNWRSLRNKNNGMGHIFVRSIDFHDPENHDHTSYVADKYDPSKWSFEPQPKPKLKVDLRDAYAMKYGGLSRHIKPQYEYAKERVVFIRQIHQHWQTFILDESKGFTKQGVQRLNESIRTYVWALLGAQAQTRTNIESVGTSFDAQKQFLANVEDAIASPADIPASIQRYQDVLQYASSKVDYVFGIGLYMSPSDMKLKVGKVQGYNNKITIATEDRNLGVNTTVNSVTAVAMNNPTAFVTTSSVTTNHKKYAIIVCSFLIGLIVLHPTKSE